MKIGESVKLGCAAVLCWVVALVLIARVSGQLAAAFAFASVAFNLSEWVRAHPDE